MITTRHATEIAEAFDLGDVDQLDGPVARGEVGQVWQLTTAAGRFAIKEPFEAPDVAETDEHAAFQDHGIASGVPAPRIVRRPDGRVLLDVGGSRVRVYEWVDLRPADRSLDPAAVGRVVANLHRVDHHGANGLDPWYTDPIGADAWHALARDLAAAAAPFATRFADRCDELIALEAVLEPQSRVQTCHRDLFADNLLATPSGDLCVIDWENSGLTDPSHELAVVLFEFAGTDGHRATLLADAYRDAGGPGLVDRPATFSMAIAQLGHIGQLSASRWLADADPAQRSRNRARVEEFLDDGITLAQIDLLLDAVGA